MVAMTWPKFTVARFPRVRSTSLAACVVLVLAAGCGGDDEDEADTATSTAPVAETATETTPTEERSEAETGETETLTHSDPPVTAPEEQEGGAGDETPARSLAQLTGKGGSVRPPVVRVPPFISIRVELRSADGRTYALRFGRKQIVAGPELSSVSTTFPGLRPGAELVGRPIVGGNKVRIVASAEPGP
ncbi:MAG: hypothetical protein H0U84_00735 [Thermoleophilaceae bacterium]|nr:hypothetical protein [Thermoleophilaceae bacterium]